MDILISEELATAAVNKLATTYEVVSDGTLWKDPERLKRVIADARVLLVRNQTNVAAELMEGAPKLIAIGRLGVGLDNIDVQAASKLGIVVVAPLNANATSVAELAMGLILALARKIPQADRSTKVGGWDRKGCMGIEIDGKTLALCGFGRIGRLVATRARAFGMRVDVFDPFVRSDAPEFLDPEVRHVGRVDEVLRAADFVSVHAPLTSETRRMFNRERFGLMKQGSYFVNTSRGGLVDEPALLEALRSGRLGGAALDVREVEPPEAKVGFESMENVILLPHLGAATTEAQTRTFETVAADMERVLRGEPAENYVNFPAPLRPSQTA